MNNIINKIATISLLLGLASGVSAQESHDTDSPNYPRFQLKGYGLFDTHLATKSVGGGALTLTMRPNSTYSLGLGFEGVSSQRYSLNLSGTVDLWACGQRELYLENRYLYRQFATLNLQEFTGALLLRWRTAHWNLSMGLCNRYQAELVQRNNGGLGTLFEPMNVMFEVEGWLRPSRGAESSPWNVGLRWSNHNDFVIERVANWMYSVKGYYLLPHDTYLIAEAGIHPVGSLNLTSSYDGWFLHIGAKRNLGERSSK